MSYEAHVTDTAYCYDGSFAGFLCCVFESYARKEIPAEVCPPEEGQLNFFGTRQIFTDEQHARRVAAGLDRLGREVKDRVTTGFLCTDPGKDLTLLRFVRLCFAQGPRAAQMLGDPDAAAAFALERAVDNEACRLIEFIRFEERDGMLGAVIHPKHRILPLLRGHFCSRLPDESFLIYDAAHGTALLHRDGQVRYLAMERYFQRDRQRWTELTANARNVLEAMFMVLAQVMDKAEVSSRMMDNLKKFYPAVHDKLTREGMEKNRRSLRGMLDQGIVDGLFVDNINIDLAISVLYYTASALVARKELMLPAGMTEREAFVQIISNFFRGISTAKGLRMIDDNLKRYELTKYDK